MISQSLNGSYLLGWLSNLHPVFDYHLRHTDLPERCHIVSIDDEIIEWSNFDKPLEFKTLPDNFFGTPHVFVCKIKWIHEHLIANGANSVFCPWFHIIDHAMTLHFLNSRIEMELPSSQHGSFFCLNRNHRPHRQDLVQYLHDTKLLERGRATYREIDLNINGIYPGDDISHYIPENWGYERHKMLRYDVAVSSVVENFLKINKHYQEPINISSETVTAFEFFPTEKSMLAFFTKRLPLICAYQGRINQIRNEGFEFFDWILDHSYDDIDCYTTRMKHMIDINFNVLQHPIQIDNRIKNAIEYNYHHLINTWLFSKLNDLEKNVLHFLKT